VEVDDVDDVVVDVVVVDGEVAVVVAVPVNVETADAIVEVVEEEGFGMEERPIALL
jgi:hypothetical protein